jgi:hypothetical protein
MDAAVVLRGLLQVAAGAVDGFDLDFACRMSIEVDDLGVAAGAGVATMDRFDKVTGIHAVFVTLKAGAWIDGHAACSPRRHGARQDNPDQYHSAEFHCFVPPEVSSLGF